MLLIFAELAGERRWRKFPLPRDARTWSIIALVTATAILFPSVLPFARLLEITAVSWRAWLAAIVIAFAAVGWRAMGARSNDEPSS
jgi:hypothetical protein